MFGSLGDLIENCLVSASGLLFFYKVFAVGGKQNLQYGTTEDCEKSIAPEIIIEALQWVRGGFECKDTQSAM